MSAHGRNCQAKARRNARVRKSYNKGDHRLRRWQMPSARQIKLRQAANAELAEPYRLPASHRRRRK